MRPFSLLSWRTDDLWKQESGEDESQLTVDMPGNEFLDHEAPGIAKMRGTLPRIEWLLMESPGALSVGGRATELIEIDLARSARNLT